MLIHFQLLRFSLYPSPPPPAFHALSKALSPSSPLLLWVPPGLATGDGDLLKLTHISLPIYYPSASGPSVWLQRMSENISVSIIAIWKGSHLMQHTSQIIAEEVLLSDCRHNFLSQWLLETAITYAVSLVETINWRCKSNRLKQHVHMLNLWKIQPEWCFMQLMWIRTPPVWDKPWSALWGTVWKLLGWRRWLELYILIYTKARPYAALFIEFTVIYI